MSYAAFLERKERVWKGQGIDPQSVDMPTQLYPWQVALVRWALKKGRAAIFADCGLGKTFMQVAWADALNVPTLILAPLCVAEQTIAEAAKLGIGIHYAGDQSQALGKRIVITNYERLEKFDAAAFSAVVLDESSILKAFDGKTRTRLIQTFARTPYRLCCTATPAPNDIAELANHAEFIGLMTRPEFLATWFVHDDEGWRMKRHARQPFYRWLASWAIALRKPSDIGYDDTGYTLPPLRIQERIVESEGASTTLFPELGVSGIQGRLSARRGSMADRIAATADLVEERDEPWLIWCGLNDESTALTSEIHGAVNVQGSDDYASKVGAVRAFQSGRVTRLVSKVKILGFGLNFQHCSNMVFVGLGDSYEQYYQAIRRCWRFGQKRPVEATIVVSSAERLIVENVRRKEAQADALSADLLAHMRDFEREEVAIA